MSIASILFVDDDPSVLSGLRRMMHPLRSHFDLNFAASGAEALQLMGQNPCDIVISDMRMPGMNGAELLRHVYNQYPGTIRFILSGHSDRELILQSVGYAHQYLAKPCEPEMLRSAISRSLALQDLLNDPHLYRRIADIKSLPTPPLLYNKLVAELQSEDGCVKNVAELISKDISMTAKLLQVVNSAFFGLPTHVESPLRAVNLLGLDTVRVLVLAVGVFEQSAVPPLLGVSVDKIYLHSLDVGTMAKRIAKAIGLDQRQSDDALMAGMMHDIGQLVCLTHFRDEWKAAWEIVKERRITLRAAEAEIMGVTHAEIGAHLLTLWGLPSSTVEAVAYHHRPGESVAPRLSVLTVVHIANALVHENLSNASPESRMDMEYVTKIGLQDRLDELRQICLKG